MRTTSPYGRTASESVDAYSAEAVNCGREVWSTGGRALGVTFVSAARVWGGAEEQTRLLALGLRSRGHVCRFVARHRGEVAERVQEDGFPVETLNGTGRDPLSLWRLRRHLRWTRPDVLHLVDPHAVTCGGLAAWGMPVSARIAVRHNLFPVKRPARYCLLCDRVVCVCQAVADVCLQCGIPQRMLRVVRNGGALRTGTGRDRAAIRRSLGVSDGTFLMLTVALLNACKGHEHLLHALPQVIQRHPNVHVAFAGNGPLELKLRHVAGDLAIQDRVSFLGFRRDVPDLLSAADLFVLPSLAEGMSVVLLEAMSAACPILTTAVGGTGELLCEGQPSHEPTAWLVPPSDPQALATAILQVVPSDAERAVRGRRARIRVCNRFTSDQLTTNTLAIYREVLAGHRAAILQVA